jgi:hypothetical protein
MLTFVYGANLVSWGWFVSQFAAAQISTRSARMAWLVAVFFIVEILMNAVAVRSLLRFLKASRERMEWIATKLSATDSVESKAQSPFPFELLERVAWLFLAGTVPMIGLWLSIAIYTSIAVRR